MIFLLCLALHPVYRVVNFFLLLGWVDCSHRANREFFTIIPSTHWNVAWAAATWTDHFVLRVDISPFLFDIHSLSLHFLYFNETFTNTFDDWILWGLRYACEIILFLSPPSNRLCCAPNVHHKKFPFFSLPFLRTQNFPVTAYRLAILGRRVAVVGLRKTKNAKQRAHSPMKGSRDLIPILFQFLTFEYYTLEHRVYIADSAAPCVEYQRRWGEEKNCVYFSVVHNTQKWNETKHI